MKAVFDILKELGEDNGKTYKENVVRKYKDHATFVRFLKLALDPNINFYQRKLPVDTYIRSDQKAEITLDEAMDNLMKLSRREVTGNDAKVFLRLTAEDLSAGNVNVLMRILDKQVGEGVSEGTVNKAIPGLIPEFPVMLASPFKMKLVDKIKWPAVTQTKMDGMRATVIVEDGTVSIFTRNGKPIDLLGSLDETFLELANALNRNLVLDGELLCKRNGKILDRKTGNGIINKAVKGTIEEHEAALVHMVAWDLISIEGFHSGLDPTPYNLRIGTLNLMLVGSTGRLSVVKGHVVNNFEEAQEAYLAERADGQEGIILKTLDGPWENKRSKNLIKFKAEEECDLVCIGWDEGTGKNAGRLGALQLASADGKLKVGVGTGFTDDDRNTIGKDVIGKVVAVKYNEKIVDKKTGGYSLFLPVFVEVRTDKTKADTLEDIV